MAISNQFGVFVYDNEKIIRKETNTLIYVSEFIDYYITTNHSAKETATYFNITLGTITKILNHYGLVKSRALSHEINKRTCQELYGDPTYNNAEQNKKTCQEKYGCDNVFQTDWAKEKSKQTKLELYGDENFTNSEQRKQTNIEKYGVATPCQNPAILAKAQQTCLEHFGVKYPMQSDEVKAKYDFDALSKKAFETKKKHGTTNSSKIQDWFIAELVNIFGDDDVFTEYADDPRYPYHCDAYIKSLDRFIELNIYFTHGKHPYDPASEEDQKLVEKWQQKAKDNNSNFYLNAIYNWTVADPEKLKCATEHNLDYIMLYTNKEVEDYIKQLKAEYTC